MPTRRSARTCKGFGSQAKIHTRNNVGASGKIYFGTKQGYPERRRRSARTIRAATRWSTTRRPARRRSIRFPVPHHGINSITPDESRGVAYISTCSDHRPGPGENSIFLILDLKTGKYRELMDTQHIYGFIVVDHLGRAYHPILGGDIARYDPKTDKLERLKQTIDGKPPTPESRLALTPKPDPINWDISPDGKTLYCVPMSGNGLYAYDLTAERRHAAGQDARHAGSPARRRPTAGRCASARAATCGRRSPKREPRGHQPAAPGAAIGRATRRRSITARCRSATPTTPSSPTRTASRCRSTAGCSRLPDGTTTTKHVILGVCRGEGRAPSTSWRCSPTPCCKCGPRCPSDTIGGVCSIFSTSDTASRGRTTAAARAAGGAVHSLVDRPGLRLERLQHSADAAASASPIGRRATGRAER